MSQPVREGVDLVQQGGQSIDGGAKQGEDKSFAGGNVLVELVVGRKGIRVIDTQLDESFLKEVPDVDEVLSRSPRSWLYFLCKFDLSYHSVRAIVIIKFYVSAIIQFEL